MSFLITIHGEIRWLLLIVALLALIRFGVGLFRGLDFTQLDRRLMAGFTGIMDLNVLLGLIVIVFGGGLGTTRLEHAGTMLLAVIVTHSSAAWRKSEDAPLKFRNNLIVVAVALVLVLIGVTRLRGGWLF